VPRHQTVIVLLEALRAKGEKKAGCKGTRKGKKKKISPLKKEGPMAKANLLPAFHGDRGKYSQNTIGK